MENLVNIFGKNSKIWGHFLNMLYFVMFADSYLTANIESWNKACTLGKYYSCTEVIFACVRIYICVQAYICCVTFLQWL